MIPSPLNLHTTESLEKLSYEECYNLNIGLGWSEKYLEGRDISELRDMIIGVGGIDREKYNHYQKWFKMSQHNDNIRYKVGKRKW